MRKAFLALLAVVLVVAFALPAQAQAPAVGKYLGAADFNFRGQYWQWGTAQGNTSDFDDGVHDNRNHIFQRFRLYFDTSYEGKYGGTLGLEWNWEWGSDRGDVRRAIPGQVPNGIGGGPRGDDLSDITRVKHAYIWFMLPNTPVKISSGLGVQPGIDPQNIMFASNDYFGVRLDAPLIKGVLNLSAFWLKDSMGRDPGLGIGFGVPPGNNAPETASDDSDYYGFHMTAAMAKWLTLGTYHVWGHARENGRLSMDQSAPTNLLGGRANFNVENGEIFWHGLYFHAKPGMFFINAHANYMWGDNEGPGVADPDPSGAWALFAQAGIQTGPFKVSARGWYFSGDANGHDDQNDRWFGPDPFFASAELWYSGYKSWGTGVTGYEGAPGGTAFAGIEAEWQVSKQLLLELLAGHLWFTSNDKPVLAKIDNDARDIGWEVDLSATYKIYPNLSLILGVNYLFAGEGLDHVRQLAPGVIAGDSSNGDDAYELFWRLLYTF